MPTTVIHKNFTGADAVHQAAFVQSTDPGTVGASLFWIDTSTVPPAMKIRNSTNTGWTAFGIGSVGPSGTNGTNGAAGPAGPSGTNIISGAAPYANIQDQKALGIVGGTFTSGSFQTRTLNTVIANDQFLAALNTSTNQITLQAGTYRVSISCPAFKVSLHQSRLQNITNGATILLGTSEYAETTTNASSRSFILGKFALTGPSVLEVQHRCSATSATQGFGVAASLATEVYTVAEFWLEGPPPPFMGSTQLTAGQIRDVARGRPDFQQHSLNMPPQ